MSLSSHKDQQRLVITDSYTKPALICYHDNCMDGLLAAAALSERLKAAGEMNYRLLPISYGQPLPFSHQEHFQADVYFVDFCPTVEQLLDLATSGLASVTVLDHHDKAVKIAEEFHERMSQENREQRPFFRIVIDQARSGCGLAHSEPLVKCKPLGELGATYLLAERYDLWKHNGSIHSDENYLAAYFSTVRAKVADGYKKATADTDYKSRISALDSATARAIGMFSAGTLTDKLAAGRRAVREQESELIAMLPSAQVIKTPKGHLVVMKGVKGSQIAMLSELLRQRCSTSSVLAFVETRSDNTTKLSLRAGAVIQFNLSDMAASVDPTGGGHPNAAGCVTTKAPEEVIAEITKQMQ